jgi:hypothetical protein
VTQESLEGFRDITIEGQVICTVKYADHLVLLGEEEAVLQGVTERQTKIGKCYGMEMNVGKTLVMRI